MNIKQLLLILVFMIGVAPMSYASFPVNRTAVESVNTLETAQESAQFTSPAAAVAGDDQVTALLLWFFLGGLAGHRWYLGSPIGWNILFILTLGGLGVWWIIDGIDIITENYPGL